MKKYFTLVEILVVIGIIGLLCALIFPVFFIAREKSRKITCVSNLRQISQGVLQYTQDYDGYFPTGDYWLTKEIPYINKNNLSCPSAKYFKRKEEGENESRKSTGYAYNTRLAILIRNFDEPSKTAGEFELAYPSMTVLLADQAPQLSMAFAPDMTRYMTVEGLSEKGWTRHSGGANYAFCDGHVKWYRPEQVLPADAKNDGTKPTFEVLEKH